MTGVNALISLISISFIFVMAYWFYQDYRVDLFRQRMFSLRDELFDYALKGDISFDSECYRLLRGTMNGSIRFAHRVNFMHFSIIVASRLPDQGEYSFTIRYNQCLRALSFEQREHIKTVKQKMNFLLLDHMVMRSPIILLTLVPPLLFSRMTQSHISTLMRWLKKPIRKMDSAVMQQGDIRLPRNNGFCA
jgi:hypothetical protein